MISWLRYIRDQHLMAGGFVVLLLALLLAPAMEAAHVLFVVPVFFARRFGVIVGFGVAVLAVILERLVYYAKQEQFFDSENPAPALILWLLILAVGGLSPLLYQYLRSRRPAAEPGADGGDATTSEPPGTRWWETTIDPASLEQSMVGVEETAPPRAETVPGPPPEVAASEIEATPESPFVEETVGVTAELAEGDSPPLVGGTEEDEGDARERDENAVLSEIGRAVNSMADPDGAFQKLAAEASRLLSFDRIVIDVANPGQGSLTQVHSMGVEVDGRSTGEARPVAGTITDAVVNSRSGILVQPPGGQELSGIFRALQPEVEAGLQSSMAVPLYLGDTIVGSLQFYSLKSEAFSEQDVAFAEKVGLQVRDVFSRLPVAPEVEAEAGPEPVVDTGPQIVKLPAEPVVDTAPVGDTGPATVQEPAEPAIIAELQQESHRYRVMAELGRIINSSPDIGDVFERFAERLASLVPLDSALITLLENSTANLVYVSGSEISDWKVGRSFPIEETAVEAIVSTRTGLLALAESPEAFSARFRDWPGSGASRFCSMVQVPLVSGDAVLGTLWLSSAVPNAYSQQDLHLVEQVGAQIVGAVARAQANAALQQESNWRAVLNDISRAVSSSSDTAEMYDRVAEEVIRQVPADQVDITRIDLEARTIAQVYSTGASEPQGDEGEPRPLDGTAADDAIRARSSLLVQGLQSGRVKTLFPFLAPSVAASMKSFLTVPLAAEEDVFGTIELASARPRAYTDHDAAMLDEIGALAARPRNTVGECLGV